jgi:hypothetical protein
MGNQTHTIGRREKRAQEDGGYEKLNFAVLELAEVLATLLCAAVPVQHCAAVRVL